MKSAKQKALEAEAWRLFRKRVTITRRAVATAKKVLRDNAQANPTRRKHEYWCSNCGGRFQDDGTGRCPHCGARLKYKRDKCRLVFKSEHYLREAVVYGEWQVIKEYIVDAEHRSGKAVKYDIVPVYLWWFNPKQHATLLLTRYLTMMPAWARIPFAVGSAFHFRNPDARNYWHTRWKDTEVGGCRMLNFYRIRGIDAVKNYDLAELLRAYTAHDSILETLFKTGQGEAARLFIQEPRYRKKILTYWRSWVLARRHGFDIGAVGERMYLDYLDNLKMLRRDLRNPFYICPADFPEAHAEAAARCMKIMDRRQAKAARTRHLREQAESANRLAQRTEAIKGFAARVAKYAGLTISDEAITVRPLMSIEEFRDEGEAMQHCVYSNSYFARPECLILSARDAEGQRLETVEVSLRDWTVVQSRAYKNGITPMHDRIIGLVIAAMPEIKKLTNTNTKHKKSA